ncbi:MAG: UDP-2,3-diacylglucosamine diphosphatase [Rubrivivax sp.]|nr:UDP-2,3-diacylglucosamine diphosphatase [Rubrivivax sp.]
MAGSAAAGREAVGALPAYFEFVAPRDWKAIDFISDLHLCEALPRTFQAWSAHLRHTPADAVLILGDLFEAWVGDDSHTLPFERRCLEVLADAASHRTLAFMVGNRDFLLGTAMLRASGMMGLPDPTLLEAWGQRVLLSHGDALCLDDRPYQEFRAEVRSAPWQQAFLARPLAERRALAAEMRRMSSTRHRFDGDSAADVDAAAAVRWLHAIGAAEMVHGHTHRPGSNALAPGFKRHVLSDWDLDTADRAEVLRLTRKGFERIGPAAR